MYYLMIQCSIGGASIGLYAIPCNYSFHLRQEGVWLLNQARRYVSERGWVVVHVKLKKKKVFVFSPFLSFLTDQKEQGKKREEIWTLLISFMSTQLQRRGFYLYTEKTIFYMPNRV